MKKVDKTTIVSPSARATFSLLLFVFCEFSEHNTCHVLEEAFARSLAAFMVFNLLQIEDIHTEIKAGYTVIPV